jgi:magnesium-transporting ATPase (P-type)
MHGLKSRYEENLQRVIAEELEAVLKKAPKKKDHHGETCAQAHPEQEHEEWEANISEVSSEKQRRWACAQKDKPASSRKKSLSAAEAEEMCKSQVEEK